MTDREITIEEAATVILRAGCSGVSQLTYNIDRALGAEPTYAPGDAPWPAPDGNSVLCEAVRTALEQMSRDEQ